MTLTSPPATAPVAPAAPSRGLLHPLGLDAVRITGGFWGDRQTVNAGHTLGHIASRLESEGWLSNFDRAAAGTLPEGRRGREFADSEIYKWLEAVAWEIGRSDDDELDAQLRIVVARIAAAQEHDGYLHTGFGRPGQQARWSDLEWGHELYCLGHLFQAAVARERTRPGADDGLVRIARRAADLVCTEFGRGAREAVCGHPEVEVGLAELGRALGEERYVAQAGVFVDRRGRGMLADIEWGRSYYQDDVPVREAEVLRGHAVRANYLAAGAVDVAIETSDDELLEALRRQWARTRGRRTYVTGGQGSHHQDEAFGEDGELPPDRAYSETCAGIGSIMFSWRMLLAEGRPAYADLIERTLFNVVATSPSADGRAFFYANTLHQRTPGVPADPDDTSPRASSSLRAPWFDVSCCPPNVARTLASLASYVATSDADGVQLHQYAPAEVRTALNDGRRIAFDVATDYPRDGRVHVTIRDSSETPWTLSLRVPDWAHGARLRVTASDAQPEETDAAPGTVSVRRAFAAGDVVELELPVSPRITRPAPEIDAIRGTVAVERGPEVLAVESVDLPGEADVARFVVDDAVDPVERDGRVWVRAALRRAGDPEWPYGTALAEQPGEPTEVPLVAYHEWAQRGPSTMRIWMPTH